MKKIMLMITALMALFFCQHVEATEIYLVSIKNTTVDNVKTALTSEFKKAHYEVKINEPNRLGFKFVQGDGLFTPIQRYTVYCEMTQDSENVRIEVSKKLAQGFFTMIEDVEDIVPIIKNVKQQIDGTPIEYIVNEHEGAPEEREALAQRLGIALSEQNTDGTFNIKEIEPHSAASSTNLAVGDKIFEINARPINSMTKEEAEKLLAERWEAGLSIMFTYERDGTKDIVSIKRAASAEK